MNKKLLVGSKVSVVDENINGEIISIHHQRITIIDEDGFEYEYAANKLVLKEPIAINIDTSNLEEKHIEITAHSRRMEVETIDLHLPILNAKNKSIKHPLEYQLNALRESLYDVKKNKIDRLIIIHGKGEGILKKMIIEEISSIPNAKIAINATKNKGQLIVDFSY